MRKSDFLWGIVCVLIWIAVVNLTRDFFNELCSDPDRLFRCPTEADEAITFWVVFFAPALWRWGNTPR